jgi:hypothetical protein
MTSLADSTYGPFSNIVQDAGQLVATAVAIMYAWIPRKGWDLRQQDLPGWLRSVALAFAAVGLVILTLEEQGKTRQQLVGFLIVSAVIAVALATAYIIAFFGVTHPSLEARRGQTRPSRVVGGFKLRSAYVNSREAVSTILEGNAYEPEQVWTTRSLAVARAIIALLYVALLVAVTLLIAAAVIAFMLNS